MAGIAAFADVDIAAGELERRVEPHVRGVLDRLLDGEQRRDLDQAADARHNNDPKDKADRLAFQPIVKAEYRHDGLLRRLRGKLWLRQVARLSRRRARYLDGHPDVVGADAGADQEQQSADG